MPFSASYTISGGRLTRVTVVQEGSEYLNPPLLTLQAMHTAGCVQVPVVEAVMLLAQSDLLVDVQPRHYCENAEGTRIECEPDLSVTPDKKPADLAILGVPQPQFSPGGFPGEGLIFRPSQRGGVDAAGVAAVTVGGQQGAGDLRAERVRREDAALVARNGSHSVLTAPVGHVIAYAGHPVELSYTAVTNWCQDQSGELLPLAGNLSCLEATTGSVSIEFGPLPSHDVSFTTVQDGGITDLLITYDNPFEAARPLHEHPIGYHCMHIIYVYIYISYICICIYIIYHIYT